LSLGIALQRQSIVTAYHSLKAEWSAISQTFWLRCTHKSSQPPKTAILGFLSHWEIPAAHGSEVPQNESALPFPSLKDLFLSPLPPFT